MPNPNLPIEGSCRCGEVGLRITAAPLITMACHCKGCQKRQRLFLLGGHLH